MRPTVEATRNALRAAIGGNHVQISPTCETMLDAIAAWATCNEVEAYGVALSFEDLVTWLKSAAADLKARENDDV